MLLYDYTPYGSILQYIIMILRSQRIFVDVVEALAEHLSRVQDDDERLVVAFLDDLAALLHLGNNGCQD